MNSLEKKAGYVKGLMEGMTFAEPGMEKLVDQIVELLSALCDRVEELEDMVDELNDYVESIDDDLSDLESEQEDFGLMNDDIDGEFFDNSDGPARRLHLIGGGSPGQVEADVTETDEDGDGDDIELDVTLGAVACPECKQPFFIRLTDPEDATYTCPHCGKRVAPDPLNEENSPIAKPVED